MKNYHLSGKTIIIRFCLSFIFFWQLQPVYPWYAATHVRLTAAAVKLVAKSLPEFFGKEQKLISLTSQDPDFFTEVHGPALRVREKPDHYFDSEYLEGEILPQTRYEYYQLLQKKKLDPQQVGCLPYAIWEWTERLTGAFAQHRKWPESKEIQIKCLVYAGIVSHYVQDLAMPLHVTMHYDGWMREGVCPRIGLHQKMDALLEFVGLEIEKIAAEIKVKSSGNMFVLVTENIKEIHKMVEEVYSLQNQLLTEKKSPEVVSLATRCCRKALSLTGTVLLTAWESSSQVVIPDWLEH